MTLTGLDQLWVADLTYIRLELEFVYLAVILEAFLPRVIGRAPDTKLTLQALGVALVRRRPAPGPVHHSHRGVQYAESEIRKVYGPPDPSDADVADR